MRTRLNGLGDLRTNKVESCLEYWRCIISGVPLEPIHGSVLRLMRPTPDHVGGCPRTTTTFQTECSHVTSCKDTKLEAVNCKAWFGPGSQGRWTLAPVIHGSRLCGPGPWWRRCRRIRGEPVDDLLVHPQLVD
jgi:hypothetical protein